MTIDTSTPILVLGGKENSLSLARHLGMLGITVRVSGPANCWGMYSRYCRERFEIPFGQSSFDYWHELFGRSDSARLRGHVLLACSDEAIDFVAKQHQHLIRDYRLIDSDPHLADALLDKRKTLELARRAGVNTPNFWSVEKDTDLEKIRGSITFPVLVKPIRSHLFARVFGKKLFIIEEDFEELLEKVQLARDHDLAVMIMEMVPGPDELLSSYYTYIDHNGNHLFHFTKRILRRYPVNRGNACYHITEWLPETAELGRRFFREIGFRGLGNIEFKRDTRDGKLKIIEVNARFTAAQEQIVKSGAPIDQIVYCHLTDQTPPTFSEYDQGLRYWYPVRDFLAFMEMRKRGELSFKEWFKSVLPLRHVDPLFNVHDLMPCYGAARATLHRIVRGRR